MQQMTKLDLVIARGTITQAISKVESVMEGMPPFSEKRRHWQESLSCLKEWLHRIDREMAE